MLNAYMINENAITLYTTEGGINTIDRSYQRSEDIIALLNSGDYEAAMELVDVATQLEDYGDGSIKIVQGEVTISGKVVHNVLTRRIIDMWRNGDNISSMVAFMSNLHDNPSARAVQDLYRFLEANSLPITNDGHFLAYKNVNHNYKDRHSNTFDNSVGSTVEMPRNEVQDDPNVTCSTGLHFCSMHYLRRMWGTAGHTMIVKINPADVVSVPVDYDNSKGRTCKYVVIDEHLEADTKEDHSSFSQPVVYTEEEQALFSEGYDNGYEEGFDDGYYHSSDNDY